MSLITAMAAEQRGGAVENVCSLKEKLAFILTVGKEICFLASLGWTLKAG